MDHSHDSHGNVIPPLLIGQGWCEKHHRVHPTGECPDCSLERSKDTLKDLLEAAMRQPDPYPFLFREGQKVRVRKKVVNDGQTPKFWAGAVVTVVSRRATWLSKTHSYTLQHPNGAQDVFEECELDRRYRRT